MSRHAALFERLSRSRFRARFALGAAERRYLAERGLDTVRAHARDFVEKRLADAEPKNDGKQTPMRGHPVFIAQHATATCCRGCLAKWHGIAAGHELSEDERSYVADVIAEWLKRQEV